MKNGAKRNTNTEEHLIPLTQGERKRDYELRLAQYQQGKKPQLTLIRA